MVKITISRANSLVRTFVFTAVFCSIAILTPLAVQAASAGADFSIENVFTRLTEVLNRIIPFLVLLATVLLLYGIVRYVGAGDDESKVEEGRRLIFYGIIGLAILVTVWAFVNIVIDFFFSGRDFNIPGSERVNTI